MKIALIILVTLSLTGCGLKDFGFKSCPLTYNFYYKQKVKIKSGFYRNQTATVLRTGVVYVQDSCNQPGYHLKLSDGNEVSIFMESELEAM